MFKNMKNGARLAYGFGLMLLIVTVGELGVTNFLFPKTGQHVDQLYNQEDYNS